MSTFATRSARADAVGDPRAPRLGGITFEILDDAVERLGPAGVIDQLARARESWRLRPAAAREAYRVAG